MAIGHFAPVSTEAEKRLNRVARGLRARQGETQQAFRAQEEEQFGRPPLPTAAAPTAPTAPTTAFGPEQFTAAARQFAPPEQPPAQVGPRFGGPQPLAPQGPFGLPVGRVPTISDVTRQAQMGMVPVGEGRPTAPATLERLRAGRPVGPGRGGMLAGGEGWPGFTERAIKAVPSYIVLAGDAIAHLIPGLGGEALGEFKRLVNLGYPFGEAAFGAYEKQDLLSLQAPGRPLKGGPSIQERIRATQGMTVPYGTPLGRGAVQPEVPREPSAASIGLKGLVETFGQPDFFFLPGVGAATRAIRSGTVGGVRAGRKVVIEGLEQVDRRLAAIPEGQRLAAFGGGRVTPSPAAFAADPAAAQIAGRGFPAGGAADQAPGVSVQRGFDIGEPPQQVGFGAEVSREGGAPGLLDREGLLTQQAVREQQAVEAAMGQTGMELAEDVGRVEGMGDTLKGMLTEDFPRARIVMSTEGDAIGGTVWLAADETIEAAATKLGGRVINPEGAGDLVSIKLPGKVGEPSLPDATVTLRHEGQPRVAAAKPITTAPAVVEPINAPGGIIQLNPKSITTNPLHQPRVGLDEENIQRLIDNFDPNRWGAVEARLLPSGEYELIHGHHRLEAARRMGMEEIAVKVLNVTDDEAIRLAETGNLAGKPLTVTEMAGIVSRRLLRGQAPKGILDDLPRLGLKTTRQVEEYALITNLPDVVKQTVDDPVLSAKFTPGHAIELARAQAKYEMPLDEVQAFFSEVVMKGDLSPTQLRNVLDTFAPVVRDGVKQTGLFDLAGVDVGAYTGVMATIREAAAAIKGLGKARSNLTRIRRTVAAEGADIPELTAALPAVEARIAELEGKIQTAQSELMGKVSGRPSVSSSLSEMGMPERSISPAPMAVAPQTVPSQISTPALPPTSAIRTISPSTQLGLSSSPTPTSRPILQQLNTVEEIMEVAGVEMEKLQTGLTRLFKRWFIGGRIKAAARIQEKLDAGRDPNAISDFLGLRLISDNFDQTVKALEDDGWVILKDDLIARPDGYRGRHIQIKKEMDDQLTAELQVLDRRTAGMQEAAHQFYELARQPLVPMDILRNATAAGRHLYDNAPDFTVAQAKKFNKERATPPPGTEDLYQTVLRISRGEEPELAAELLAKIDAEGGPPGLRVERVVGGADRPPSVAAAGGAGGAGGGRRPPVPGGGGTQPPLFPPDSYPPANPPSGRPRTIFDMAREAMGMRGLTPEMRAAAMDMARPLGRIVYEPMAWSSHAARLLLPQSRIVKWLLKQPGIKQPAGVFSPNQLARDNPIQMIGVTKTLYESVETARARLFVLSWWSDAERVLGFKRRKGIWRAEGVKVARPEAINPRTHGLIDDLIDHPERYDFTPEQAELLKLGSDTQTNLLRLNQRAGVDVVEIGANYWHRIVRKGPDVDKHGVISKRLGGRKGYTHRRAFEDMDLEEAARYTYETNPAVRLAARLEAGIRTLSDAQARQAIKNLPGVERPLERLTRKFPEIVAASREALAVRNTAKAVFLKSKTRANEMALRQAEARYVEALHNLDIARGRAGTPTIYEMPLPNGRIAPAELVEEVKKYIELPETRLGKSGVTARALEISQLVRTNLTWLDLAAGFIQGQVLFSRHLPSWLKGQSVAITSIVDDPLAYIAKNYKVMDEGILNGAVVSPTEYLFPRQGIASIPTRIPLVGTAMRASNRAFEWYIVTGMTELYKVSRRSYIKAAAKTGDDPTRHLVELGQAIRKELGVEDYAILGVRPTQQTVEAMSIFASRFFRATVGIVAQAATKGPGGHEARKAMGAMLAGGLSWTIGAQWAINGRLPNLDDPEAPDWLGVTIGKTNFNFFGPFYSLLRAIARSSIKAERGDFAGASNEWRRYLQAKASVGIRAATLTGEFAFTGQAQTFEGDVLPLSGPGIFRGLFDELLTPITVGEVYRGFTEGRPESALEVFGLNGRASAFSQMNLAFRVSSDINPEGLSLNNAEPWHRDEMNRRLPDLAKQMVAQGRGKHGEGRRQRAVIDETYLEQEQALREQMEVQWQPRVFIKQFSRIKSDRYQEIQGVNRALGLFQEEGERPDDVEEAAVYDYYGLFEQATDDAGIFDGERFEVVYNELQAAWSSDTLQYVERNTGRRIHTKLGQNYMDAMEALSEAGYFDVGKDYVLGSPLAQATWEEYLEASEGRQRVLGQQNPGLRGVIKARRADRDRILWDDPELDIYTVRWFGDSPRTLVGQTEFLDRYHRQVPLIEPGAVGEELDQGEAAPAPVPAPEAEAETWQPSHVRNMREVIPAA